MKPELHAFFLDPHAADYSIHIEIAGLWQELCEQAGGRPELAAYAPGFDDLPVNILEQAHYSHEPLDAGYVAKLTEFQHAVEAIRDRRRQVEDLRSRIAECLAEAGRLRADPDMVPHLDRLPPAINEFANAMAAPAPAEDEALPLRTQAPPGEHAARQAADPNHDAATWMLAQDKSTPAGQLLARLSDPDEVAPADSRAIVRTFEDMCERVSAVPGAIDSSQYERLLKRAAEQHFRTMTDTPENTWEKIKEDYRALFETAGGDVNALPWRDGFADLRSLVRNAVEAAHYPDSQEDRIGALLATLDTQDRRRFEVTQLTRAAHTACLRLDKVREPAGNLHKQPFERTGEFFRWLPLRDEVFAILHKLQNDPVLKHHLPFAADLKEQLDRIADPAIPTAFHPALEAERSACEFTPELHHVAWNYGRALRDADEADLLPHSIHFHDLRQSIEDAIGVSADKPGHLGALCTLQAQLAISSGRREAARAAIDDLADASARAFGLQAWSTANHRPIHEAPDFPAWRDRADEVLARCERVRTDFRLGPHFRRAGLSRDGVDTALDVLRDDRYRKPPSPEEIAAERQARAGTREESFSMSA